MRGKNTIIINGRAYDAITGQPARIDSLTPSAAVNKSASAPRTTATPQTKAVINDFGTASRTAAPRRVVTSSAPVRHTQPRNPNTAHAVHSKPQRSKTLRRQAIKRPAVLATPAKVDTPIPVAQKSPLIRKFADRSVSPAAKPVIMNRSTSRVIAPAAKGAIAPIKSVSIPAATRPVTPSAVLANNSLPAKSDSQHVKERLIKERLAEVETQPKRQSRGIKQLLKSQPRAGSIVSMGLALVMLGGYFTYINMPNLSVRVASARAGIDAGFPEYSPSGYRFDGPVAYTPGEVIIRFKSNSNDRQGYAVKQRASNWDSQAVLDNFVTRQSSSYLTYSEQGLTVYTYGNKAAWVNGGVLYTIDGDAPLSSEQVLRIAASM